MRAEIEEVLRLQPAWTWRNTPEMERRGVVVRREAAGWLRGELPALSALMPPGVEDLAVQGKDGTGRKTELPWVRVFSVSRSPSATIGFYAVYLFAATGGRAYLSLNQGTTRWENGEFRARPEKELLERVQWARSVLAGELARADHLEAVNLEGGTSLGHGYELGNIAAIGYRAGEVPPHEELRRDLRFMVAALGRLYEEADRAIRLPGEPAPEVADALTLVETTARARPRARSLRSLTRLNVAERTVIEKRAVRVATEHLRTLGYTTVKDVGATESYDLDARRAGERLYVEVKGTTSDGTEVILTKNEVDLHGKQHPATMLIVVIGIELDRDANPVEANGGRLHVVYPWKIAEESLTPIAFRYVVPEQVTPPPGEAP